MKLSQSGIISKIMLLLLNVKDESFNLLPYILKDNSTGHNDLSNADDYYSGILLLLLIRYSRNFQMHFALCIIFNEKHKICGNGKDINC